MTHPGLEILGMVAMGLLLVVLPIMLVTYYRYRKQKVINCPETQGAAEVQLDARRAAFTSALGRPLLAVKACSLWPNGDCQAKSGGGNHTQIETGPGSCASSFPVSSSGLLIISGSPPRSRPPS